MSRDVAGERRGRHRLCRYGEVEVWSRCRSSSPGGGLSASASGSGLLGLERLLRASSHLQCLLGGQHRHGDQRVTGLPSEATEAFVTQAALLEKAGNDVWRQQTVEDGAGVTVAELVEALQTSLRAYGLGDVQIEVFHPDDGSLTTLERVRHLLSVNEQSSQDIVLAYFNQGVLTGDWDGPHISPIGAYDVRWTP